MYDHVTEDQVVVAIDELQQAIGVKDERSSAELLSLLQQKKVQECVQRIATWLGLPIRIVLTIIPPNATPGSGKGFGGASLARTDSEGHGMEGITAQVEIPRNLPMFGTRRLDDYPINVQVGADCLDVPRTFLVVMAHELSHVVLEAIRFPRRDSELHTDLVPLLLGFREIVRVGRKVISTSTVGGVTTTETTTFGYVPDSQFAFACSRITSMVESYHEQKLNVSKEEKKLRHIISEVEHQSERFCDYLHFLDSYPPRRIGSRYGSAIVEFHSPDYSRQRELATTRAATVLGKAEGQVRHLTHYRRDTRQELHGLAMELSAVHSELQKHLQATKQDVLVLRRCVPLLYALRTWPVFGWLSKRLYARP